MSDSKDNDKRLSQRDQRLQQFYTNEYEIWENSQKLLDREDVPHEELLEQFRVLSKNYYRQLNKAMKITRLGDSAQRKLIKAQERLQEQEKEIKNTLAVVREKEEKLRAIFDNAVVGIAMMNPTGRFTFTNSNFAQMLGYSQEEILELSRNDVNNPGDRSRSDSYFRKLLSGEIKTYRIQKRYVRKDGQSFWADFSVSGIYDSEGNLESVLGVVADIDERIKAETKLKESYQQLKEAQDEIIALEKKNSVFAMAVSANHEINQPLMVMRGNLEMLQMFLPEEKLEDKQRKYMTRITDSIERIQRILNKFKDTDEIHFEDYTQGTEMVIFGDEEPDLE